jgi:biofilm PGA synthesis N-glycosyltransferase PgaC
MLDILILWSVFAFFSFGFLALNYVYTCKEAKKPWKIKTDEDYKPKVSLIVPTYNESEIIEYKLRNLAKLEYPQNLLQTVFIDSNSTDSTAAQIRGFKEENPDMNIRLLVEEERKGKSSALNEALKSCNGEVIVISDADCFWPPDILVKSLQYLADPRVGAISGPKKLLNSNSSWVTRSEDSYLKSMNLMKLGESKIDSTIFFEGGFSAYKRDLLERFDPYQTGSDDCGTVIKFLEKNYRTLMLAEAEFFTTFPVTWKGKLEIKMRRANQLVQVLGKYGALLFKNKILTGKQTVIKSLLSYLLAPVMFLFFVATTIYLMIELPFTAALLSVFIIPRARSYFVEGASNYLILLYSIFSTILKRKFHTWAQPQDRALFTEDLLAQKGLI